MKIRDRFSYEEKINLRWLRYLIIGMAGIWLVIILFSVMLDLHDAEITIDQDFYIFTSVTLRQLADSLKISEIHLSQVINQHEKTNFYDFINRFRLEEFKRLAPDPRKKHFNILALAFDCGFNSKSAFPLQTISTLWHRTD